MTVRIVIERHVKRGKEEELNGLLKELRVKAIKQQGYLSGETLRSVEDDTFFLVISNWLSESEWKAWEDDPERREILARIKPLLKSPPKTTLFTSV